MKTIVTKNFKDYHIKRLVLQKLDMTRTLNRSLKRVNKKLNKCFIEVLQALLIDIFDKKLNKSQAKLIDLQYAIASQVLKQYGGTISFKVTTKKPEKKNGKNRI